MATVTIDPPRPAVILKDDQGATLSTHEFEFQAVVEAELQAAGTYTIERPTVTLIVTG